MLSSIHCFGGRGKPGLAPAGEFPFFACPKKGNRKKGQPQSGPLRGSLCCSCRGGDSETRLTPQTSSSLIPSSLRCSALPGRRGAEQPVPENQLPHCRPCERSAAIHICDVPAWIATSHPLLAMTVNAWCASLLNLDLDLVFAFGIPAVMRRRVAQGQTDQGWRCLSEASLARPRLHRATQCARRADESGSPFFRLPFFGEAKKGNSPAGARPGLDVEQHCTAC